MPEGVIILPSFYEAICNLTPEEQLESFHSLCQYGLYNETIEMSKSAKVVYLMAKPTIDASKKRYAAASRNSRKRWDARTEKKEDERKAGEDIDTKMIRKALEDQKKRIAEMNAGAAADLTDPLEG